MMILQLMLMIQLLRTLLVMLFPLIMGIQVLLVLRILWLGVMLLALGIMMPLGSV